MILEKKSQFCNLYRDYFYFVYKFLLKYCKGETNSTLISPLPPNNTSHISTGSGASVSKVTYLVTCLHNTVTTWNPASSNSHKMSQIIMDLVSLLSNTLRVMERHPVYYKSKNLLLLYLFY